MSRETSTAQQPSPPVSLTRLLSEFYPGARIDDSPVGTFEHRKTLPSPHDRLLDHDGHMTETVEAFYGCPVTVQVHRHHRNQNADHQGEGADPEGNANREGNANSDGNWYCREITLAETTGNRTVQYGIVRLNVDSLQPEVWRKIESRQTPLGRVLIENGVLRQVELMQLWRIEAGPTLVEHLGVALGTEVFGRTALIHCDRQPAIELLEIVTPPTDSSRA